MNVWTDNEAHAAKATPDTVGISIDPMKFGITEEMVNPGLTILFSAHHPAECGVQVRNTDLS
ncbi:hypothetical protein [Mycobacterium uberis]|uniref:hypothetical protein n=1 Tax=Mycobacterium uberis TaxID=2162698 RepID=UPI000E307520|nr:hypothetical protein [Mycobacterium uberis]